MLLGVWVLVATAVAAAQGAPRPELVLVPYVVLPDGARPVALRHAGDGTGRLFVADQRGLVHLVVAGRLRPRPFLDIRNRVEAGGEKGLLGLAFSPRFASDRRFYVYYTHRRGRSLYGRLSRFEVSPEGGDKADADSEEVLLEVAQPWGNHNGGDLHFGPDGHLYLGLGDGGAAGDPEDNARDRTNLLGALVRIDVGGTPGAGDESCGGPSRYAVPPDNPYRGADGRCDEIWAWGLRNPWRWSFDRGTGDLFIADVGQDRWEEVNFEPAGSGGGRFYGWSCREGAHVYDRDRCDGTLHVDPVIEYGHDGGHCSVIGGYRHRGPEQALNGLYFFADFCSGALWYAWPEDGVWRRRLWRRTGLHPSSFGEDEAGRLYLLDLEGTIYRLTVKEAE